MSIFLDQADFMKLGGQKVSERDDEQAHLYATFICDEAEEFEAAHWEFGHEKAEEVKEAVDVIVVAAGFLITLLGVEGAQKAWNAVHESNLAKAVGGVEKRADGKILQNAEYKKIAKAKMMAELEKLLA
jgi:predicted HAD superfamily Cof-like phosphohydrolase